MTTTTIETELKLSLSREEHDRLLAKWGEGVEPLDQVNRFFDSADRTLSANRWALRFRLENAQPIVAAKGPGHRQDGITERIEVEAPYEDSLDLFRGSFQLSQLQADAARHLEGLFGDLRVEEILGFHNLRRPIPFEGMVLELDHSSCKAAQRWELELELPPEQLAQQKSKLHRAFEREGIRWLPSDEGKMAWASRIWSAPD